MKKIISSDTQRKDRIPPGQRHTYDIPILHYSHVPNVKDEDFIFKIRGMGKNLSLGMNDLQNLPQAEVFCDLHCVTGWSRTNVTLTGVLSKDLISACPPPSDGMFVTISCLDGYTTNLSMEDFLQDDVIFA
jgi:DMSO/TMAO reductase YedYZ molybdopterin-dependent catalytic subunit